MSREFRLQQLRVASGSLRPKRTANSMVYGERMKRQRFDHHTPTYTSDVGISTGYLFKLLVAQITVRGLRKRMQLHKGLVPRTARDADAFHSRQGKKFIKECHPSWREM